MLSRTQSLRNRPGGETSVSQHLIFLGLSVPRKRAEAEAEMLSADGAAGQTHAASRWKRKEASDESPSPQQLPNQYAPLAGGKCKGWNSDTPVRWMYGIQSQPLRTIWDHFKAWKRCFGG